MDSICLIIEDQNTKDLLQKWLHYSYDLVEATHKPPLNPFSLLIADKLAFDEYEGEISKWRSAGSRRFPLLLIINKEVDSLTPDQWETIDEVVTYPLNQQEVQRRITMLLEINRYKESEQQYLIEQRRREYHNENASHRVNNRKIPSHQNGILKGDNDKNYDKLLLDRIMANMMEGLIVVATPDAKIVAVSKYAQELSGWPQEPLKGTLAKELPVKWHLFHPDGVTPVKPEQLPLSRAIAYGDVVRNEGWMIKRPDGKQVDITVSASPIYDQSGVLTYAISTWQDITERKRAEEDLTQNKQILEQIIEILPVGLWQIDRDGNIILANQAGKQIWGGAKYVGLRDFGVYKGWTTTGKPIEPEDWAAARAICHGETIIDEEITIETLGGIRKTILNSAMPIRDVHNDVIGAIVINQDITSRKNAEITLAEREKNLTIATKLTGVAYWTREEATKRYALSDFFYEIFGIPQGKQVNDEDFFQKIHPDDLARVKADFESASKQKKQYDATFRFLPFGKEDVRFAHAIAEIEFNPDNSPQKWLGAIQDITEIRKTENALRESEQIMRYIIKHDPNAIAVFDRDLRYIAMSDRYLDDYNIRDRDIQGKYHYEVFPELPQRWKDVHQRALAGETIRNEDDSFIRHDGSITYNRWECRPWHKADGEIGGMITYTEVTTERKLAELALAKERESLLRMNKLLDKANARLRDLDELKTNFVSVASHELRTPITSIIGFTQTLLSKDITVSEAERDWALHVIEKEGKRLGSLVQNLLDISRIESGGDELKSEEFDLEVLVRETLSTMNVTKNITVKIDTIGTNHLKVLAVRERIRQVIRNVLDNAIRYTPSGGTITITISPGTAETQVSIRDNGVGLPKNELSTIFERFHRVKRENEPPSDGSGLGLAIAKEIIKKHKGKIWAESEVGIGSTFYFTIPKEKPAD